MATQGRRIFPMWLHRGGEQGPRLGSYPPGRGENPPREGGNPPGRGEIPPREGENHPGERGNADMATQGLLD